MVVVVAAAPSGTAHAQRTLGRVEVTAPRLPDEAEQESEAAGFLTVVPVLGPSARAASVADLVEREAGIRVRSAGGLGTFTAVSIRGSDAAQVAVFLDGVPLNRAASAVVDLSRIPADAVERIEIHRGLPPPELGGQGLSGAINIITRKGARAPAWRASAGMGSFATRSATVGYGFGGRRLHADASLAYHGSRGDFTYYDDNGTPHTPGDDNITIRRNNGFDQLAADVELGGAAGTGATFSLGAHGFLKHQGVPGRGSEGSETRDARLTTGRLLVNGAIERRGFPGSGSDVRLGAWLLFDRNGFNNAEGERVGPFLPARTDGKTLAAGGDVRFRMAAGTHELWTGLFTVSYERFFPHDLLVFGGAPPPSSRLRGALVLADEVRLAGDRVAVVPSLRLEAVASMLSALPSTVGPQAVGADRNDAFVLPQLGLRWRATHWLVFKGSVGRHLRVPTTIELFGDGAFFLPRPSLRPETATAGDVGLAVEGRAWRLAAALEADLFGRVVSDYIAIVPAGHALSAANAGDRSFLGVEVRGRARLGDLLAVTGGYTFLHATGGPSEVVPGGAEHILPNQPDHKLDLRAELTVSPFTVFYELAFTSDVWLDPPNLLGHAIPGRALHALGFRAGPLPRVPLTFSVEVRNLANQRLVARVLGERDPTVTVPYPLVDFFDYPLPGRAIYLTLSWRP